MGAELDRSARTGARRRAAHARGDYATALRLGKDNIAERTAVFGADNFRVAVDYNNVAMTLQRLGRHDEAETALQRARVLIGNDPGKPVARIAALDQSLCQLQFERGLLQSALTLCARAIAQSEQSLGAEHPQTLAQRHHLAGVLLGGGDLALAEQEANAVVAALRRLKLP